ncbi:hypothetical protein SAMN06265378_1295 [Paracoccus sediminis]|nr:hypothetical protein SAMN06265378_1295 [Paracoccus sediminis]
MDGLSAVASSVSVVGRYWWNIQMKLLQKVGVMPFFRAHWWLFLVVGFFLLAFLYPIGVAFVVSAFCAGAKDPKAENDFIVPLRGDSDEADYPAEVSGLGASPSVEDDKADRHNSKHEDLYLVAGIAHVSFLNAMKRELNDEEFSAAALGAFDGTVQALGIKLNHVEMFSIGAAFIVRQLKDLERLDEVDPERIADLTAEAMNSRALENIRKQAGQVAYSVTVKMRSASPVG